MAVDALHYMYSLESNEGLTGRIIDDSHLNMDSGVWGKAGQYRRLVTTGCAMLDFSEIFVSAWDF